MQSRSTARRPTPLLVGVVLLLFAFLISRETSESEAFPAFSLHQAKKIYVEVIFVGSGGTVHQINDGSTLCDVIKLTGESFQSTNESCSMPLMNGERLLLIKKSRKIKVVERGWMHAGKRIALSIPLDPDRMGRDDWPVLSGIGEKMAARIEQDRQDNGDFVQFIKLDRVKGIGKKSLEKWEDYFSEM